MYSFADTSVSGVPTNGYPVDSLSSEAKSLESVRTAKAHTGTGHRRDQPARAIDDIMTETGDYKMVGNLAPRRAAHQQSADFLDDEALEALLKLREELERFRKEVRLVRSEETAPRRIREGPLVHPAQGTAHRR